MSFFPNNTFIYGDGKVKSGITDLRDVGRYVARIIHDERTLNKSVYFFGDVTSQEENFELLEELSGETIPRQYVSKTQLETLIATTKTSLALHGDSGRRLVSLYQPEYNYSKFIRGDNTPEYAKYLGYLDAGELYPEFRPIGWREFLVELLEGKIRRPYPEGIDFGKEDGLESYTESLKGRGE